MEDTSSPQANAEGTEPVDEPKQEPSDEGDFDNQSLQLHEVPPLYHDFESDVSAHSQDNLPASARDKWTNKMEFIMVLLSIAVGLGNLWRFPFEAYKHGGGAFLIVYLICVIIISRPLYLLEISIGQFSSRGPVGTWDAFPLFRGVGWLMFFISFLTAMFYISILSTCVLYIVHSFRETLPWTKCLLNDYEPKNGHVIVDNLHCDGDTAWYMPFGENKTIISNANLFYRYIILKQAPDIDNGLGSIQWEMSLALVVMWLLVFLNMMFGTKSSGKAAYFTAIFPYFMLFTIFTWACTLDGAWDGIKDFFDVKWTKLYDPAVWSAAITQSFFSLGVGYGSTVMCGSFNPFHQATYNDAVVVGVVDTLTSLFSGMTVFASLGVLKKAKGVQTYKEITTGGPGLVFVAYPDLISRLGSTPIPQIVSVLFFVMLITLGVGSQSAFIHLMSSTLYDQFPILSRSAWTKMGVMGILCTVLALFGLQFCTAGGSYFLDIYGFYGSSNIVFLTVLCETMGFCWFYGMKNATHDFLFMYDKYTCYINCTLWSIWGYLMPVGFSVILLYALAVQEYPIISYFMIKRDMPLWATAYGWTMFIISVLIIPVAAIIVVCTRKTRSWKKKLFASVFPNSKWGPKEAQEKLAWVQYKQGQDGDTRLWKMTLKRFFPPIMRPTMDDGIDPMEQAMYEEEFPEGERAVLEGETARSQNAPKQQHM